MRTIIDVDELAVLYPSVVETAVIKEVDALTSSHRAYIEASPLVLVATAGAEGLDCSPRGDPAGFVRIADERTLLIPDRRGNNRLDSLKNIVLGGRIALLFLVPGIGVTLRVNGTAVLTDDEDLRRSFTMEGKVPATVIVITISSVYTQCPKALIRSHIWDPALHRDPSDLPTPGQILEEITAGAFEAAPYDAAYPQRLRETIY